MDLTEHVEALRRSLTAAAAAGGEQARETARLLADTIEPAVRLTVIDALSGHGSRGDRRAERTAWSTSGCVAAIPRWWWSGPRDADPHEEPVDEDPDDDGSVGPDQPPAARALKTRAEAAAAAVRPVPELLAGARVAAGLR